MDTGQIEPIKVLYTAEATASHDEVTRDLLTADCVGEAADLMRHAHGLCPYSNAMRGNAYVELTVDWFPIPATIAA